MTAIEQNRDIWCKALESGRYKQTKGCLCRRYKGRPRYCCLGVAQKLFGIKSATVANELLNADEVFKLLGMSTNDQSHLACRNDGGNTFCEIAKVIRKSRIRKRH